MASEDPCVFYNVHFAYVLLVPLIPMMDNVLLYDKGVGAWDLKNCLHLLVHATAGANKF